MENQLEKTVETEMETGLMKGNGKKKPQCHLEFYLNLFKMLYAIILYMQSGIIISFGNSFGLYIRPKRMSAASLRHDVVLSCQYQASARSVEI